MEYTKVNVILTPLNPIASDLLMAQLGDLGFDSFCESETGFEAYIPSKDYQSEVLNQLELPFEGVQWTFETEAIADQNWNKVWEENYFQPIVIGQDCVIRSSFHPPVDGVKYDILIDPKMAFGTGHHSTTSLMVQHILEIDVAKQRILDMGCGTGILGMLCAMRGCQSVMGIDIDEWAYHNALENIELNHIENMDIQLGGAELLTGQSFDMILANINRNILLEDMQQYANVLKPNGLLLLSGFYLEDLDIITKETQKHQLSYLSHKTDKNWVAAVYKKAGL
ncbi:MAG: 50S ribosomal protein L11 methyltransferase [Marinilabiliaceae bacterium]|nr:50S ribosomal protein L11 methyltransferase [Marinilabiliaceae bacterium]